MTKPDLLAAAKHTSPEDSWHGQIKPDGVFPPEAGRYHLVIGLFCPFAHRANLVRHLKGLDKLIDVSVVKPYPKGDDKGWPGWKYVRKDDESDAYPGADVDPLYGHEYLHQLYFKADPEYKGRYSVPVLWDKKSEAIVSNESADLLRWLPTAFPNAAQTGPDLYPPDLRAQIDDITAWMQPDLNAGVYRAGFARDEQTYAATVPIVFAALNRLERIIADHGGPYILGNRLTEVDVRAYATTIRFDPVYVQHFKCNLGMIRSHYPVINNWLKNLYHNVKGFRETTDFRHIKENYTKSHGDINPFGITPVGPLPHVEEGVLEFKTLGAGGVDLPAVKEVEGKL